MEEEQRTVKALVCEKLGNPALADISVLKVSKIAAPYLPPNCVRIRVVAAGLNFADALQIQGQYQERPALPFVPGSECSGIVTEVGRDVRSIKPGDRVVAVTQNGAFAEEVVAPGLSTVKVPSSCDIEAAAGLPVAFGTAWMALHDRANVTPGQTVLILGAGGGVGLAAVQISKILGAKVIAVARGSSKMAALKAAGADVCVDMNGKKAEELKGLMSQRMHGKAAKVDVLFDPVGGALFTEAFKMMAWGGHVVIVGFASGKIPSIPANIALVKALTISGIYWGKTMKENPTAFRQSLESVARLFAGGDIFVNVSHKYSLEEAREGFSVLMNREIIGKLLFCPSPRSML